MSNKYPGLKLPGFVYKRGKVTHCLDSRPEATSLAHVLNDIMKLVPLKDFLRAAGKINAWEVPKTHV